MDVFSRVVGMVSRDPGRFVGRYYEKCRGFLEEYGAWVRRVGPRTVRVGEGYVEGQQAWLSVRFGEGVCSYRFGGDWDQLERRDPDYHQMSYVVESVCKAHGIGYPDFVVRQPKSRIITGAYLLSKPADLDKDIGYGLSMEVSFANRKVRRGRVTDECDFDDTGSVYVSLFPYFHVVLHGVGGKPRILLTPRSVVGDGMVGQLVSPLHLELLLDWRIAQFHPFLKGKHYYDLLEVCRLAAERYPGEVVSIIERLAEESVIEESTYQDLMGVVRA